MDDEASPDLDEADDSVAGWGAWSRISIDDSVREIKAEIDDDFENDCGIK